MEEAVGGNYWCHMCSRMVNPILEVEIIKCPFCQSGFVEEINSTTTTTSRTTRNDHHLDFGGSDSDRALSLWAPILLGMMSNRRRRRRFRRMVFEDDDDDDDDEDNNDNHHRHHHEGETELDRELESLIRRTRRSSASILQLLQEIREGSLPDESENADEDDRRRDSRENRDGGDRERVILVNPLNQTIILRGSYESSQPQNHNQNNPIGSLGDYFVGPGLDLLLQHLAENDPNRYGTAPARKEAVEALPTVNIKENLQCSVCLDDFEIESEAKELPCNHKFHSGCILPWLDLHSSCPVCRHQLPAHESKIDSDGRTRNSNDNDNDAASSGGEDREEGDGDDARNGGGRRFSVPLPWPFSSLFSSSGNGNSSSTTSTSSSSTSSTNAPPSSSHAYEN